MYAHHEKTYLNFFRAPPGRTETNPATTGNGAIAAVPGCRYSGKNPQPLFSLGEECTVKTSFGEAMKKYRKSDLGLVCLVVLITVATLVIAGCLESNTGQQSQTNPAGSPQNEKPVIHTTITTGTMTSPAPPKTAQPIPAPGLSTMGITIDPIGDKKTGDKFLLAATTSLPAGTNIFWQIMQDTGTPPTGLDKNSQMSVGGNNLVMKGNGTSNRISLDVDLGRLIPGKYVVIIGEMKGDFSDFEIGDRYGYTYVILK
jgi:hypothetical protein